MSSSAPLPSYTAGPTVPVPADDIFSYVFSNPCRHLSNDWAAPATRGHTNAAHSFRGQVISPQRPAIIHAATGASVTWERLRFDALRVARSLRAIVGQELAFDGLEGREPIHSPSTTVLICLPNCAAFACILMGSMAALCTVTTASPVQTPTELAMVMAKARPQVVVTAAGSEGEGRMQKALDIVLDSSPSERVAKWAKALKADWDYSVQSKYSKGELPAPISKRRIWTVKVLNDETAVDYYGSNARPDGIPAQADPRDWTHLLQPPPGHKHAGSLDSLEREPFQVRALTKAEQRRRAALILWSSGTTGTPKGVLLSHENLVAIAIRSWVNVTCLHAPTTGLGETWIALAPWTHVMGLALNLFPAPMMGATLIIPPASRFHLPSYLSTVERYRATYLHVAPPVVAALANVNLDTVGKSLTSVRGMASGGAPTPVAIIRKIYERFGIPVHLGYGASEAGYITQSAALGFSRDDVASLTELGSVGVPGANLEISIQLIPGVDSSETIAQRRKQILEHIDADQQGISLHSRSKDMADIVPGEICLRGPSTTLGYFSGLGSDETHDGGGQASSVDKKLTSSAIDAENWYHTGDEGCIDKNGQLWIVGRLKELIKIKGYQVSPSELDATFIKHPDVLDVAAAGTPVTQKETEEKVCLYVVPRELEMVLSSEEAQHSLVDKLSTYIKEHATHYKRPSIYVFCSAIPKNPTGKILRRELHKLPGRRHYVQRSKGKSPASKL